MSVLCSAGTGLARVGIDVAEAEVGPLGALHVCAPVHILLPLWGNESAWFLESNSFFC